MRKVNNGYTNFVVLAEHGERLTVSRVNDFRTAVVKDGPLTFHASDLKEGHILIKARDGSPLSVVS